MDSTKSTIQLMKIIQKRLDTFKIDEIYAGFAQFVQNDDVVGLAYTGRKDFVSDGYDRFICMYDDGKKKRNYFSLMLTSVSRRFRSRNALHYILYLPDIKNPMDVLMLENFMMSLESNDFAKEIANEFNNARVWIEFSCDTKVLSISIVNAIGE